MSEHILHVAADGDGFTIECVAPDTCNGWIECTEAHAADGIDATDGPYNCDESAPWCDEDEWEFHGKVHAWRYGYGWTLPYPGCVVAGSGAEPPDDVWETTDDGEHRLKPGRWLVDDDWDDTDCHLALVGPA